MQAAVGPQRVQAALQANRGLRTDVPVENFSIATHGLDRPLCPFLVEAEHRAEIAFRTQETVDLRIVGRLGRQFIDVGLGNAKLFRGNQSIGCPAYDVAPIVVTVTRGRAERLFGDDLGQDHVVRRILERRPRGSETGSVSRINVAASGEVVGACFFVRFDRNRLILDVV